jgi:UbiD family decarboxylase
MAFRDHLAAAEQYTSTVSVNHEMMDESVRIEHRPIHFQSVRECPGHTAAMNILTRQNLCSAWRMTPSQLLDTLGFAMANPKDPKIIQSEGAPCLENQAELNLYNIPIPWHHKQDAGRYMSASVIVAERNGQRNLSFHRQLVSGPNKLTVRMVPRHLRQFTDEARADGEELSIAIINGIDPTILLAAAMSFNERVDEFTIAAALHAAVHGSELELVRLPNGVHVPINAEYVMEARITLRDDDEGPYVDITGTIDEIRQQPIIEVDSIHHRHDPVFHALLPAGSEHRTLMGLPRAPTIRAAVSEVCECNDVHLSEGGCGWLSAVVQITPKDADSANAAIHAALAGHPSMKQVTIVDTDVDVDNPMRVEWAMMTRWQPDSDTVILSNQKGSSLDPSRAANGTTSKVGFDGTIPFGADKSLFHAVF